MNSGRNYVDGNIARSIDSKPGSFPSAATSLLETSRSQSESKPGTRTYSDLEPETSGNENEFNPNRIKNQMLV